MCRGIEYVHIVVQTPASRTFSSSRTESPHSLNTNSPAPCPGSHCSYLFSVSECNYSRPLPNWVPSHPSRAPSRPPPHLGTCPQYPAALRVPVLVLLPSPLPELPAPHSGPHLASCPGENAEANELLFPYAIQVLLWPWPFPWPGAAPPLRLPVLLLKKQESGWGWGWQVLHQSGLSALVNYSTSIYPSVNAIIIWVIPPVIELPAHLSIKIPLRLVLASRTNSES